MIEIIMALVISLLSIGLLAVRRNEKETNSRLNWCEEQARHLQQTYMATLRRVAILEKIPVEDYEDPKPTFAKRD